MDTCPTIIIFLKICYSRLSYVTKHKKLTKLEVVNLVGLTKEDHKPCLLKGPFHHSRGPSSVLKVDPLTLML